ncbi:hypothetical protein SAY86_028980 [Trapa natans]|uniref:ent-kaurene monooxygenase n=1 Tax=Trapa natans TaxID=22666 RepID=A0AAN7R946_TRANT|nr:hypothetical protein SAY86_028980 [Trapa natans]
MALLATLADFAEKAPSFSATVLIAGLTLCFVVFLRELLSKMRKTDFPALPAVPGLPIIGNLLQLKEKKPHKTFAKWAETYGPIYSIKTGAHTLIVLNSNEVAKEAMVTRFSSISSRNLSNALQILTANKNLVAMSDYNDFHKMVKRYILQSVLGANAQRRYCPHRDTMVENICRHLHDQVSSSPDEAINFRSVFEDELFGLALKQAVGNEVQSIYVEELGTVLSKKEMFKVLVTDFMAGAIEVDWRDFFPYMKWVPYKSFENNIHQITLRRKILMRALIQKRKQEITLGQEANCYLDRLLSESNGLTEDQIMVLLWEPIIETADTTLVTSEWALYELARDPKRQDRLYEDIKNVCGIEKMTEEQLPLLPYLGAIFHETLRKHSPVPIVPPRYVHEDTQLGGYFVPKGSQIAINIFGCNMDKNRWEDPGEWIPERFLDEKYDPTDLYKTMAFGAGKRVCAGSLQANLIACMVIGRMVQEFEWRLEEGEEEKVDTVGLTTRKLHPMQAILKPRRSSA